MVLAVLLLQLPVLLLLGDSEELKTTALVSVVVSVVDDEVVVEVLVVVVEVLLPLLLVASVELVAAPELLWSMLSLSFLSFAETRASLLICLMTAVALYACCGVGEIGS